MFTMSHLLESRTVPDSVTFVIASGILISANGGNFSLTVEYVFFYLEMIV
jgi:hypothetical protein